MTIFWIELEPQVASTILVFLVIITAGALGGSTNYIFKGEDSSDAVSYQNHKQDIFKSILLGIAAAFTVPVFLRISSGGGTEDIIYQIVNAPEIPKKVSNLFFLGGFCQIAALSARKFLQGISQRILEKQQKQFDSTIQGLDKIKSNLNEVHDELLGEEDTDPNDLKEDEISSLEKIEINKEQNMVLTQLALKPTRKRSISKIRQELNWDRQKTRRILNELTEFQLSKMYFSEIDDKPRWKVTALGLIYYEKFV